MQRKLLGLPNPLIWLPGFFVGFIALAWWTYKRDTTASFLFALFIAGWFPFLILGDALNKPVFMFYATPMVPYVVATFVHVLYRWVLRWPWLVPYVVGYIAASVGAFAYFYPIYTGQNITYQQWLSRMWLGNRWI